MFGLIGTECKVGLAKHGPTRKIPRPLVGPRCDCPTPLLLLLLIGCMLSCGCGRKGLERVVISGNVTYQGQPLKEVPFALSLFEEQKPRSRLPQSAMGNMPSRLTAAFPWEPIRSRWCPTASGSNSPSQSRRQTFWERESPQWSNSYPRSTTAIPNWKSPFPPEAARSQRTSI